MVTVYWIEQGTDTVIASNFDNSYNDYYAIQFEQSCDAAGDWHSRIKPDDYKD